MTGNGCKNSDDQINTTYIPFVKELRPASGREMIKTERGSVAIYNEMLVQYKEMTLIVSHDVHVKKTAKQENEKERLYDYN